jgi:phosphomevalonate kinase
MRTIYKGGKTMGLKQEYEQKLQAKIDECQCEIDELTAKIDKAKDEARIEYHNLVEELRTKQEAVREILAKIRETSEDVWEKNIKPSADSTYQALTEAVKRALEWAGSKFK